MPSSAISPLWAVAVKTAALFLTAAILFRVGLSPRVKFAAG
jgi:hypothetical protein